MRAWIAAQLAALAALPWAQLAALRSIKACCDHTARFAHAPGRVRKARGATIIRGVGATRAAKQGHMNALGISSSTLLVPLNCFVVDMCGFQYPCFENTLVGFWADLGAHLGSGTVFEHHVAPLRRTRERDRLFWHGCGGLQRARWAHL